MLDLPPLQQSLTDFPLRQGRRQGGPELGCVVTVAEAETLCQRVLERLGPSLALAADNGRRAGFLRSVRENPTSSHTELGYFQFGGSDFVMVFERSSNVQLIGQENVHVQQGSWIGNAYPVD